MFAETPPPETQTPPEPTEPTPPEPVTAPPISRAEERVKDALADKNAAEKRAKEAEEKLAEREKAELSERERAEKERDEARNEAAEATARATKLEREGIAARYAREAGFIDPSDAAALIDLQTADTEAKIKSAVGKLAEEKTHLVGQAPGAGFGHPGGASPPGAPDPDAAITAPSAGAQTENAEDAARLGIGRDLLGSLRRR